MAGRAQTSRIRVAVCLCLCLLLSSAAPMAARNIALDDDDYHDDMSFADEDDHDDDVSFTDDDDSYSGNRPARRLYDDRRFNVLNTNSSGWRNGSSGAAFCRLLSLQILDLSNNQLTGKLPDCWWNMQALQFLDLSNNSFHGEIPEAPSGHNCTLESLHLAGNGFTGAFPSVVNGCGQLVTLDISNNRFAGGIPPWIGHGVPSLKILSLRSNQFTGEIPTALSQLGQLQLLDLANNNLTGLIPREFVNLSSMRNPKIVSSPGALDGSNYQDRIDIIWKGQELIFQRILELVTGMDLSNNHLSHCIPEELTTLYGLKFLNLSRNNLSCGIPQKIGSLKNLESLDLSFNQLSGSIPSGMGNLISVTTLNLSYNNLSGKIPSGNQIQTLTDPSIYSHNPGLCGFPLPDCANASAAGNTRHARGSQDKWMFFSVTAGFAFGFWLWFGMLFSVANWRTSVLFFVDGLQCKITRKIQDSNLFHRKGNSDQFI